MAKENKAIDIAKCWIEVVPLDFEQYMYICRGRSFNGLLGVVWGQAHYGEHGEPSFFEVQNSYVPEWCRRCGIRSLINEKILKDYIAITTDAATSYGNAWMKANGYKQTSLGWIKKRK